MVAAVSTTINCARLNSHNDPYRALITDKVLSVSGFVIRISRKLPCHDCER